MRQFKFRAWHKELNILISFDFKSLGSSYDEGCINFLLEGYKYVSCDSDDIIIMQYLGEDCKDCKGIEICEEDIVKTLNGDIGVVKYMFGKFLVYLGGGNVVDVFGAAWGLLEIIGNARQHPELLPESLKE